MICFPTTLECDQAFIEYNTMIRYTMNKPLMDFLKINKSEVQTLCVNTNPRPQRTWICMNF